MNLKLARQRGGRGLPEGVGKWTRRMDTALPGKHTRRIYDGLTKEEAGILAQLRTNMSKLREYLFKIGAADTPLCKCGYGQVESAKHFLFLCNRWSEMRPRGLEGVDRGNISKVLGGKGAMAREPWTPNTKLIKATIQFVKDTRHFEENREDQRPYRWTSSMRTSSIQATSTPAFSTQI